MPCQLLVPASPATQTKGAQHSPAWLPCCINTVAPASHQETPASTIASDLEAKKNLTNSFLIRLLLQKGIIELSEVEQFYNNLKAIDLQAFREIHKNVEDAERLETMHRAYLETVETARDLDTHGLR